MFTGIIEEVGTVKQITHGQHSEVLNIQARTVLENTKIGDSIAVNGICLTVTRLFADSFSADVMHETLNRSSLAGLMVGSRVNLERAMAADGRFGGHIVAGQTDIFYGVAAASPSVWFPGFVEYLKERKIKSRSVYLSLGNKEEKTKNSVMSKVGDCIRELYAWMQAEEIQCTLEWNQGGHFKDPTLRVAKAFAWVLNTENEKGRNG